MADNKASANIPAQATTQSMAVKTAQSSIFAGNDAKRMSFDGNMPQYNLSQSPGTLSGLTSGLIGGMPSYNRDRRDSLKNMVHLQDFGTD